MRRESRVWGRPEVGRGGVTEEPDMVEAADGEGELIDRFAATAADVSLTGSTMVVG